MSEFYGIPEDELIGQIEDGITLTRIAASVQKNRCMLTKWLNSDEKRSARAREARRLAAASFEEQAEQEIRQAMDPFELSKAKELAHHYRWRASKAAPKEYGDKLDLNVKQATDVRELTTEELLQIIGSAGGAGEDSGEAKPNQVH